MSQQKNILGIDIGSVSAGFVVISRQGQVLDSGYTFHKGDIQTSLRKLLADVQWQECDSIATTSSAPGWLMATHRYNNQVAIIRAAKHLYPDLRGLLNVGGEKFNLDLFDSNGHFLGARTNTSCAAGTGSFLDQQAGRLNLRNIQQLSEIACNSKGECPQIASRCAVFAKTDLIHAQQEGYQLDEISNGLCRGLAKNIVDTLFAGNDIPEGDLLFCGGVSKNTAVVNHIENYLQRKLIIPEMGHLFGALGCALTLVDDLAATHSAGASDASAALTSFDDLILITTGTTKKYYYPPLQLEYSAYPEFKSREQYEIRMNEGSSCVEVDIYEPLTSNEQYPAFLGIDIGSTSTKAVLINESGVVLCGFYTRTAGRPLTAVQEIFFAIHDIETRKNIQFAIIQNGTTGSGRKFIGSLIGADGIIDEITAHARAAYELNPEVDTIIEIGGQDAKFTTLVNGRVTSSTMNNVCAAGTGSFIEEQATRLGCPIHEYAERTDNVRAPMTSDRCTVFMERDINHFLSEGYSVDEVLAAALHSVRENYLLKVATEKHIGKTVFFQGATAKNRSLVAAFEQRLQRPILVSKFCHLTGALGTALIVRDEMQASTRFRGINLYQQQIPVQSEICQLCANHCKLSVAHINGERVAYGFLCGRDYDTQNFVHKKNDTFDLLATRKKLANFARQTTAAQQSGIKIGIPAAVHLVDDLQLWQKFFDLLGINTVTSAQCPSPVKAGKQLAQAEFCAPMTAMYGHVQWLLQKADFVFLPNYLENRFKDGRRQYCYYTQFIPALAPVTDQDNDRILRPVVRYLYTSFHTKMQLYRMLQKILPGKFHFLEVVSAYDKAVAFDKEYRQQLQQTYTEMQAKTDDIQVVFVGRPYTLLSPSLNSNIPGIFRDLHIDTFFQDMIGYNQEQVAAITPLLHELHWEHASKILEVTEVAAQTEGLYPVYVTSFKCSPDSFGIEYFKSIMARHNKPYLILELDEHDSSVGYETRIEAAVRAFRNHHQSQRAQFMQIPYVDCNPDLEPHLNRPIVLFPNWDRITCYLLTATLQREGYDARLLEESDESIRESLKHNTGQCIPLNGVAQCAINYVRENQLDPANCILWMSDSTLGCNIRLYPHHIKQIFKETGGGMEKIGVFKGDLAFTDISLWASHNAYFAYLLGGMLRKIACKIRPYEQEKGVTDRVLNKSIKLLGDAFTGKRSIDKALDEIVTRFEWIETKKESRPKVAIFGDLYSRDNSVFNQNLIRFIEANGGEVITTPYSEYAKMIAGSYFKKWFNEGKYLNVLTNKALLAAMTALERKYMKILSRVLDEPEHSYTDNSIEILEQYNIASEHTGESMDNILKIHYLLKHFPDIALLVQASPALCCASLVTEAMKTRIEQKTGVPVVSITYDGTGGQKNEIIVPYLRYPQNRSDTLPSEPITSMASMA